MYAFLVEYVAEIHTNQFVPFVPRDVAEFIVYVDKFIGAVQKENSGLCVLYDGAESFFVFLEGFFCRFARGDVGENVGDEAWRALRVADDKVVFLGWSSSAVSCQQLKFTLPLTFLHNGR